MVLRFLLDGGFASPFGLTFLGGGGGCVALSVRGGERTRKRYARTVWKAMQKKSRNGHVIFVEKPSPKTNMQRNRPPCATPKRKPHLFVLG